MPYRQELPLLSAVFLTAALDGPMSAHDEMGAATMHRFRIVYFSALTLTSCAFSFCAEALALGPDPGVVFVRSVMIWLGIALLSVRVLGQQLGWVIPLVSAFFLIWYPLNWWDWTADPADDVFSWTAAAIALTIGVAATAATPWRRKVIFPRRKSPARATAA